MGKLPHEDRNATRFVWANGLQSVGDQIVAAKTVLPWLLHTAGAPSFFSAMLVPIRESGSMLPQAVLTPWVVRQKSRKRVWVIGSLGQALAAAGIGFASLTLDGSALGWTVITLLAILSLFRALCSIASKDVQGRTISKGRRGFITGRSTVVGGIAAIAVGVGIAILGRQSPFIVASLIFIGAAAWFFASPIFATIQEPESEASTSNREGAGWSLLKTDRAFRRFILVRSCLLVSALSPSFIVMLSAGPLNGLGLFLIASGLASLLAGRISGVWSDRSSKNVMVWAAAFSSFVLVLICAAATWLPDALNYWLNPLAFFLVTVAHTAVRVARKTYVVDMAEGDLRTQYVAIANSAMGVILLVTGVISGWISSFGPVAALLFLAAIGGIGVLLGIGMKNVSLKGEF